MNLDQRFVHSDIPKWNSTFRQNLWGTELVTIEPSTKSDTVFEFDLPNNSTLLFGPNSGFIVKGIFEKQNADNTWDVVPAADYGTVVIQPNWFENAIKSIDVFHNNTQVKAHDVPRFSDVFVNSYLYAHMHPEIKKCLCPEPCNTGNAVPKTRNDWVGSSATCSWANYSKTIYTNGIKFCYIPPFTFPFYQQSNFCRAGRPPTALPMPVLGKMCVIVTMKDNFTQLIAKAAAVTSQYRFVLESIKLVVEEARLNPTYEKTYLSQKNVLAYEGNTHFGLAENITEGVMSHRCRFQDVYMPEGIFIFALPKTVLGGNFQFGPEYTAAVFSNHNIDSVDVKFQNMPLVMKSPNFGQITEDIIEIKMLADHQDFPPFGVLQDPVMLSLAAVAEGGKTTAYPHAYLNLCPSTPDSRLVPIGDDGKCITKTGHLDLTFKFKTGGATADVTYFAYIFYTDVSMLLDLKSKQFVPMYKRHRSNL